MVEATLAKVQERFELIPEEAGRIIFDAYESGAVTVERVNEIEDEIKHDIMAVVKALAEQSGDAGEYVHFGTTSNDIIDTCTALQIRDSLPFLEKGLKDMWQALALLADKHRNTVMLGRTHGQWAVPLTFGLKMAVYAAEMKRHFDRFREMEKRVVAGKTLGAVGTGAAMGGHALVVQQEVMRELGLISETAPTQLVGRDRYVELVNWCGSVASSLEKFATEVRNLQRPEIAEVSEAFDLEKQVGSSTMAQKKNPITSENVCGLARIVRSNVVPQMENVILWHERDLTNSSSERFILPHSIILTEDILVKSADVFRNLHVDADRMKKNLDSTGMEVMAESVMMSLARKGMGRQKAHEMIREVSMSARKNGTTFLEELKTSDMSEMLGKNDFDLALDPEKYTGVANDIIDRVLSEKPA